MKGCVYLSLILSFGAAQECVGDTFLPAFPDEVDYNPFIRGIFYFIGMVWFFLGISISADKFMESISVITSKKKKLVIEGQELEVLVWNETVANLTLMALGSSAPEILLATIETVALGFEAGELGPGTIVGSAAFNLLIISGICVIAVPKRNEDHPDEEPGIRYVKEVGVFSITSFFGMFAYIWLLMVLAVISPDEVELWEALVTLSFFPILVLVAYAQDRKLFQKCCGKNVGEVLDQETAIGHVIDIKHADGSPED
jgi:solute carrier family 8 (sodium/calcium exchanger)